MLMDTFRRSLIFVARKNAGYGNPSFLAAIGAREGQNWCSIFGAYCIRRAHEMNCAPVPSWIWRKPYVPEPGAKRLLKNIAKAGRWLTPDEVVPGDFVVWHRGALGRFDWRGHFGIVVDRNRTTFQHVSGNAGKPPQVRERRGSFDDPKLWRFAGLR